MCIIQFILIQLIHSLFKVTVTPVGAVVRR